MRAKKKKRGHAREGQKGRGNERDIYIHSRLLDDIKTTDQLSLCFAVVWLPDNITDEKQKERKYDGGKKKL